MINYVKHVMCKALMKMLKKKSIKKHFLKNANV